MTEAEKRIREAFSRPTLIEREDVRTLLTEIDLLRERQFSADMCLDAVHEARRVLREHFGGNLAFLDDDLVRGVVKMKEEIDRLTREREVMAKDAERLDFVEQTFIDEGSGLELYPFGVDEVFAEDGNTVIDRKFVFGENVGPTLRAAIDAALVTRPT